MDLKFYKKYNNKTLEDDGYRVSEEYKKFQRDLYSDMKKLAKEKEMEITKKIHGHYFESYFFKNGDKYVYVHHESLNRTFIDLDSGVFFLVRTAKNDKDYTGGTNDYCCYSNLVLKIIKYLQ